MESTSTLKFKDNTVTKKQDSEVIRTDTYEIENNQLKITLGDYNQNGSKEEADAKMYTEAD